MNSPRRPLVLCVLDGFGHRDEPDANAVMIAKTPALRALMAEHPSTRIEASGEPIGLPPGQIGNSEIGHLTLGAGRVLRSDRTRIDDTIRSRKLALVDKVDLTLRICQYDECPVHLMGLLSDGGVHSHMDHLLALIDQFSFNNIPIIVHAFLDGRDTPPQSAMSYLNRLESHIENLNVKIGTLSGRFYAMDRDDRWDRVYRAYHAIVRDKQLGPAALVAETPFDAVSLSYHKGIHDEFLEPVRIGDYQGMNGDYMGDFASGGPPIWEWTGTDVGMSFNFRGDRMRQLTAMLTRQGLPDYVRDDLLMDRQFPVRAFREHCFTTMTSYGDDLNVPVAFPKERVGSTLGEIIAAGGLRQLRCAESEKYPHVTYFFNGGREEPFEGETRKVFPSPKLVETYDQKPEMAASKVADAVVEALEQGDVDFILVNFANPDMVGHTGKLEAAVLAVEAVDVAVGRIASAAMNRGATLVITADHGNCETMVDAEGNPHTAHTANPVPFVVVGDREGSLRSGGTLADVAPTLLEIMGIERPEAMTGRSLIER